MSNGSEHLPESDAPLVRLEANGHTAEGRWVFQPGDVRVGTRFEGHLTCGPHDEHGGHPERLDAWTDRVVRSLAVRWLDVTASELHYGLEILHAHGIHGDDAQTALEAFLLRLTPYWRITRENLSPVAVATETFPGWAALGERIRAESPTAADLGNRWGGYAARVAAALAG